MSKQKNWIVLLRLTSKLVIMFDRHTKQADKRGQKNQNNEFMSHNSMATPVQCMRMEIKQTSEHSTKLRVSIKGSIPGHPVTSKGG